MLMVIGSIQDQTTSLEIDDYIPFVFRSRDIQTSVPLYWRTGDFKNSLMEIGINSDNGGISLIKIPFFGAYELSNSSWQQPHGSLVKGLPVCGLEMWQKSDDFKEKFKDEIFALKTRIGQDFVSFWISHKTDLSSSYICGQLCVGIDKNQFIRKIEFINLSTDDIQRIIPLK